MDAVLYGVKHMNLKWLVLIGAVLGTKNNVVWWCALTLLIWFLLVESFHAAVMGWVYRVAKRGALDEPAKGGTENG